MGAGKKESKRFWGVCGGAAGDFRKGRWIFFFLLFFDFLICFW